ncbi:hypothetical protein [Psychrobacter sp. S1-30-MNA-CIBAN-0213]|uniref:hypothetical protein n=1 Tax=Psychrobacter sp. S1-30-MNA-CIBAN-0213 TaxID=3140456 RepID=UPI00331C1F19
MSKPLYKDDVEDDNDEERSIDDLQLDHDSVVEMAKQGLNDSDFPDGAPHEAFVDVNRGK